jgi:hypothetical protein
MNYTIGIRVSEAEEDEGLDSSLHGESLEAKVGGYEIAKPSEVELTSAPPAAESTEA